MPKMHTSWAVSSGNKSGQSQLHFQMLSMELEEESKRSLAMEAEVEKYVRQLTKHREDTNSKFLGKDISNQHRIQ